MGGKIRKSCGVEKIIYHKNKAIGVLLVSGEIIECDYLLSTIGRDETMTLLGDIPGSSSPKAQRLGFVETIYQVPEKAATHLPRNKTIIFYNDSSSFSYKNPADYVDFSSGVICFPGNFQGLEAKDLREIRSTHLANYSKWKDLSGKAEQYKTQKRQTSIVPVNVLRI